MRRGVPMLLMIWALGGLLWTLGDGVESPDDFGAAAPSAPPAPQGAPSLRARAAVLRRGAGASVPPAEPGISVPDRVRRAALSMSPMWVRSEVEGWLEGEPRRLVALLRAVGGATVVGAGPDDARFVFTRAAALVRALGPDLGERAPWRQAVEAALRAGDEGRGALLGALRVLGLEDAVARETVRALALEPTAPVALRLQAAQVLLSSLPMRPADVAVIAQVLALPAEGAGESLDQQDLLGRIASVGASPAARAVLRPLTPALLALHDRDGDKGWIQGAALGALTALAPEDDQVRRRLSAALHGPRTRSFRHGRQALLDLAPEEILAYLQDASASVQVEGVAVLLARGLPKQDLAPLVLSALRAGGPLTRTRAVGLLAKVGTDVGAALTVIDEHLASTDEARWLSGVQALGALSTVPGDRDAAIQRLLAVARWPNVKVRVSAVQSILMHDAQPAAVLELLAALVDDTDPAVRREAVDGLGEMVATHPDARTALEGARTDPDATVRELVVYWLDDKDEDD